MECHFVSSIMHSDDMTTSLEVSMRKTERDCLFHYNDITTLRL